MRHDILTNDFATNCDACGAEFMNSELEDAKIAIFHDRLRLCKTCSTRETLDDYKEVIKIIKKVQ